MDLATFDLADPMIYVEGVPYAAFDHLRRDSPVHRFDDPRTGVPFWAVTRHADVVHVSRHPELFSSHERTSFYMEPATEQDLFNAQLMLVNSDPPHHTRIRAIVNKGFTPRVIAMLSAKVRDYAEAIIDEALAMGEADFVRWVSAELPLEVIAELMGAPREDRARIFELSNTLIGFEDPEFQRSYDDMQMAAAEMYLYANKIGAERRAEPRDDIISILANAEVEGEKLSEFEFDLFFLLLAVAGNETTRNAISNGMLAFFEHPEQWRRLRDDPSLAPSAADEVIRWAHPVMQFRRTATEDTDIGGVPIAQGDKVVIYYASANRDEEVFDDPYTFDVGRDPNPHISFGGGGPHYCLGAHLAKLEVSVMFEVLSQRVPHLQLIGPVRRLQSHFINGIKEMPVRFA